MAEALRDICDENKIYSILKEYSCKLIKNKSRKDNIFKLNGYTILGAVKTAPNLFNF